MLITQVWKIAITYFLIAEYLNNWVDVKYLSPSWFLEGKITAVISNPLEQ